MILTVPYQALEISNIHLSYFSADRYGKYIAKLMYKDPGIDFQDLSILTPALKVVEYNPDTSRLTLDLKEHPQFLVKLLTFQEYLTSTLYMHQNSFNIGSDDIHNIFSFLINGTFLNLYTYPNTMVKRSNGTIIRISDIKSGETIRCVIRIQGIASTKHNKFRLLHSLPSVWASQ